jgi:GNAT superfamily N-acetyltransferase
MDIRPLGPELARDFFHFFDTRAFSDNPDWKGCYCTFFHRPPRIPAEEARLRPTRREQAADLIERGLMRGYLAYGDDGQVLGWCNVNAKTAFMRLEPHVPGDEAVAAVVCFVIDPERRRQGIARALLERAIEDAGRRGFRAIEAYPSSRARTEAGHYHGPLALYESLGFQKMPGRKLAVRRELIQEAGGA